MTRQLGILALLLSLLGLGACDTSSSGSGIDPGIIETPVAFIKRPIPRDNMGNPVQADLREPLLFSAGGDVYLRSSTTTSATVTNISNSVTGGSGDVKGLNASFDGNRLVFSLRLADPNPNDNIVPTWNIYEYDIPSAQMRRIIPDPFAEEGDDLFPAYLPDGRIVFTSNRQSQSRQMLTDEGKNRFSALDEDENTIALVLHVVNSDGGNIRQISFNQSHDLYPQVMRNSYGGQIVFSRWDNAVNINEVNIYKVNPDGSELEILYGARSHATGTNNANIQFTGLREMRDGKLMVIAKPFTGTFDGGDILIIDTNRYVDNDKPIWSLAGLGGPAQVPATITNVTTDGSISPGGRYSSAFPLQDGSNRMLVSKSTCQLTLGGQVRPCVDPYLTNPGAQEISPAYAIWLYDITDDTEKPIVLAETDMVITEVITLQPEPLPPVIFDKGPGELDSGWQSEGVGVVNIKSVYDIADATFDGCFFGQCSPLGGITSVSDFANPAAVLASDRPARFVRFYRAVGIPDPNDPTLINPPDLDNDAFGPQRIRGMREIVGYAPVEPDGSVKVKVPANLPLALEVLDAEGRRIGPRHLNWFQLQPGDTLNCVGCHDLNNAGAPPEVHARSDARAPSFNSGLPATLQFVNTLIPGTPSPNPYWGNLGQTMAEVRFDRVSVAVPPAIQPQLSPDLEYEDYWYDDPAIPPAPPANPSYFYRYTDLDPSVPAPVNAFCFPWAFNCRITINYAQHIHPIWQVDRGADVDMNGVGDDTCTECHTTVDAMGNDQVAAGQLDLTDGISDQNGDHFKSYRELLFGDQGEELDPMGVLVNIQIQVPLLDGNGNPVLDGMGNPIFIFVDDPAAAVNPTMTVNGARNSYFIEKLTETELDAARVLSTALSDPNYIDHSAMLTGVELKLISEWLDLGAQNFNDPFDPAAPQN